MTERLRFWLIRLLAGKMPVMVNVTLRGGEIPNAWACNCRVENIQSNRPADKAGRAITVDNLVCILPGQALEFEMAEEGWTIHG